MDNVFVEPQWGGDVPSLVPWSELLCALGGFRKRMGGSRAQNDPSPPTHTQPINPPLNTFFPSKNGLCHAIRENYHAMAILSAE